jgi:hypothetical protein
MCATMLARPSASIPLQFLTGSHGDALNAIEWDYAVLMACFFPVAGAACRATRLGQPAG